MASSSSVPRMGTRRTAYHPPSMPPRDPREVGFFYKKDGQQIVEIIYDKHTMKYGERTDVPLPEKMEYVFCAIEDRAGGQKYIKWYEAFFRKAER
jgi:hypothetical protein